MPAQNPVHADVFDIVTAIIPDPGLGAQFSWAVPANARIQVDYLGFILNTSATVTNRYPTILGTTPVMAQTMAGSTVFQTNGNTFGWAFVAGLPVLANLNVVNVVVVPMSPNLILEPGDTLDSAILNFQGNDLQSSIIVRFKQWVIA